MPETIIQTSYFIGVLLLILGLKKMGSPVNPQKGLTWAGLGLLITALITYFHHDIENNYLLITAAVLVGGGIAALFSMKASATNMPRLTSLYSGMGGGAAAAIAASELTRLEAIPDTAKSFAIIAALLGCISFSGSLIAYLKQRGVIKRVIRFPMQQWINALIFVLTITFGLAIVLNGDQFEISSLILFSILAIVLGVLMTIPVTTPDTPVVTSLFNSFTGLAVAFAGYSLSNTAMMIAGMLVGAAAIMLTRLMTKAMNRPVANVLFGQEHNANDVAQKANLQDDSIKQLNADDAATMMAFARNVIIVPGYGMAVSQAQHQLGEIGKLLSDKNVNVKFAVHPAAGRMPGHMSVLLSESGVPYDLVYGLDEINDEFDKTDVVLIVGANDTTNPSARSDNDSPIFGTPILDTDKAKNVIIIKRGRGTGFAGIDNPLFYQPNTSLMYGDAKTVLNKVMTNLKAI